MTDVHSKTQRSFNMSRIRGKDTKPELVVRSYLHKQGFRFRLHVKELPGKPDLVFPKFQTVLFIHGCFWHGHKNCRYFKMPKTRTDWWRSKIAKNQTNDIIHSLELKAAGWNVLEIWECQLKGQKAPTTLKRLELEIAKY